MKTLRETNFPGVERGKVRDLYAGRGDTIVMVTTDRISAFDVVLNQQVPYKGQGLNASSAYSFQNTIDIVPNAFIAMPHQNVIVMERCEPYPVEVVIRGTLSGSSWRTYQKGQREFFDTVLPDGLRQNQDLIEVLGKPLHTPTSKAKTGHDVNLSPGEAEDMVGGRDVWYAMRDAGTKLFLRANKLTAANGYREADTKYEFGLGQKGMTLFDEANTHDSSRFFRADTYREKFESGVDLDWVDKEFVRKYLMSIGFKGDGPIPDLPPEIVQGASERVLESAYAIIGKNFVPVEPDMEQIREVVYEWTGA